VEVNMGAAAGPAVPVLEVKDSWNKLLPLGTLSREGDGAGDKPSRARTLPPPDVGNSRHEVRR